MKAISIVIVTWNCKKYTQECLESLAKFRHDPDTEIILVDNASEDGTPEMVRDLFPEVTLVQSKENLGFARGNNVGLRMTSGEYVCLINPDVRVLDGCLETMLAYMKENPRVGLLGPRMIGFDGKPYPSYMGAPTLWRTFCRALALDDLFPKSKLFAGYLMTYFDGSHTADVDILTGWFWVTRREALDQVGLMDESFFMYSDDVDWSKRFRDGGWRVVYLPTAESVHYGGGTTARSPVRFSVEMQRANFRYWQKNYSRAAQLAYLSLAWLHQAVRLVGYLPLMAAGKARREEAGFKVKRSYSCILWIMGLGKRRGIQVQ